MAVFGAATNLVVGTITLTQPAAPLNGKYWWVQCRDIAYLEVVIPPGVAGSGNWAMNPAATLGAAGDWFDSIRFPYFGPITLNSSIANAKFGSGWLPSIPSDFSFLLSGPMAPAKVP